MLYASRHPERIDSLFLTNPACTVPYVDSTYDPYSDPSMLNPFQTPNRDDVDEMIQRMNERKSPNKLSGKKLPGCVYDYISKKTIQAQPGLTNEEILLTAEYLSNSSLKRYNITEMVL